MVGRSEKQEEEEKGIGGIDRLEERAYIPDLECDKPLSSRHEPGKRNQKAEGLGP